jgi:hypothetical protein
MRGSRGEVLVDYREFAGPPVVIRAADGTRIELQRSPELRVKGLLYGPSTPEQMLALRSLAESMEGELIRRVGVELVAAAPGRELTDLRRGLEIATQALWGYFPADAPRAPVLTADYEVGAAGYVVLTQPEDLVLSVNHTKGHDVKALHDDNQVGGCFGRCGSGCTGGLPFGIDPWPSHWEDTQGEQFPYQQQVRCINGYDWIYSWYATPTTHSVTGWWTPGCQLHDNCCKAGSLVCDTLCNAVAPTAVLTDPLGEVRTWTYSDYAWSITAYNAGYSGCTCGNQLVDDYECTQ